jgi:Proto-chlorophyllide reductase 57 kD subunit.
MNHASTRAVAALALMLGLVSCATAPAPAKDEGKPATAAAAVDDQREVLWDQAVAADFEKDVPKFARKLAKKKLEEMARERGTYCVDRALYDEAMATYKR